MLVRSRSNGLRHEVVQSSSPPVPTTYPSHPINVALSWATVHSKARKRLLHHSFHFHHIDLLKLALPTYRPPEPVSGPLQPRHVHMFFASPTPTSNFAAARPLRTHLCFRAPPTYSIQQTTQHLTVSPTLITAFPPLTSPLLTIHARQKCRTSSYTTTAILHVLGRGPRSVANSIPN